MKDRHGIRNPNRQWNGVYFGISLVDHRYWKRYSNEWTSQHTILTPSDPCATPTCAAALQLRWTAYPYRRLYTSNIIPSGYAVLCSSDASQLSSLHQPHIHPRSISERCFFSPIFLLAILKVVLLVSSSGQLHHLYSPWIILS